MTYMINNLEECIKHMSEICQYTKAAYDQVLCAKVNLILANLCISGKNLCDSPPDYKRAKNYFKIFKNIHEENFIDKITIFGYERMMQCYFNIGNFDCAIKCCKRMLVLALISNDFLCEVKIYDMLSKLYF